MAKMIKRTIQHLIMTVHPASMLANGKTVNPVRPCEVSNKYQRPLYSFTSYCSTGSCTPRRAYVIGKVLTMSDPEVSMVVCLKKTFLLCGQ